MYNCKQYEVAYFRKFRHVHTQVLTVLQLNRILLLDYKLKLPRYNGTNT
jgi:hypothetical protein